MKYDAMTAYRLREDASPFILNFGTRWRWVISFTHRSLPFDERASAPFEQDKAGEPITSTPQETIWKFWRKKKNIFCPLY